MYNRKLTELFSKARADVGEQLRQKNAENKSKVYFDSKNKRLDPIYESVHKGVHISNEGFVAHENSSAHTIISYDNVKEQIRRIFCKYKYASEKIGCHPDFEHLIDSERLDSGYAVTMFFDIVGSTKLGLTYSPSVVFNIKNTIIKYVIEIIQAFDGHVHRIMGDAVMAFFRSHEKSETDRRIDSGIDAINAGVYILEFMKQVITPILGDFGADEPVGVRIGIDFAKDEEIIWGNYDASGAFEVTATSFYVDVAAKLQQAAQVNSIMVGDSFKKLLGLGDEYLSTKYKMVRNQNGREEKVYFDYVRPNYRVRGELVNYKQYQFDNEKYFKLLPFGLTSEKLTVRLRVKNNDVESIINCPCSISLDKNSELTFEVEYKHDYHENYTAYFEKQNTGPEAKKYEATEAEVTPVLMSFNGPCYYAEKNESTLYHGLHHMKVRVCDSYNEVKDSTVFSIFIK